MSKVLYISASPRAMSVSNQGARIFLEALGDNIEVEHIDLFKRNLPEVTEEMASAKVHFMMGSTMSMEEQHQWNQVLQLVEELKQADHYLIAVPMWNFSLPYKLKHYIDLVNHPNLTFARDENGPRGIIGGTATVIYSRGGDYSPKNGQPDPLDFQSTYLRAWLTSIGVSPINEFLLQQTMFGPDAIKNAIDAEANRLRELASNI
ncbi:MAG TPA: FMN-dependent NADH-azoreductase [Gammaproteobacteria bacterium]|nr:FMN-dependent NADH-azoreductase [Gammaproteobacteria bacterium]